VVNAKFIDPAAHCSGVTEISVSECVALLDIYNDTNGDERKNNVNR